MRSLPTVAVALLVVTALVGGFAGTAAGATPIAVQSSTDSSLASTTGALASTDGPVASTDETATCTFPLTVTDATGEEITLNEPPERITTTNPSAAQTLWELGLADRVVGVTQFALYLDGAETKANVSAEFGISVERVVDTKADLVLAPNASAADVEPLRDAGETVYHFHEATDVDDIAAKTERIGQLTGACEEAAETNDWMYEEVAAVEERTADLDRPAALYPLGDGFVAAGNTFINEIMTLGGTENVAAADHEGYPQLSDEVILETDPELILVTDPDAWILDEEPYRFTTAGQQGNAVVMEVHYLNQPAPRSVVESTTTLATAVEEYVEATETADADGDTDSDAEADSNAGESKDTVTETEAQTPTPDIDDGEDFYAPGFGVVATLLAAILASLAAARVGGR